MNILVVGMGYMGLPTALLLAQQGHAVTGLDIDAKRIATLQQGTTPFDEPGLEELLAAAKVRFTTDIPDEAQDAIIIMVPTPLKERRCDLRAVKAASRTIAPLVTPETLVVLESTVPPGTTENVVRPIIEEHAKGFMLAYVSEKAIPGNTLEEMRNNSRIIGGTDEESANRAKDLYESFVEGPIHITDCTTAEMAKVVENTYRDLNIALANELSQLTIDLGVNVWEVIALANEHPRVNVHKPGPGVGGHCIPIDPWFLTQNAPSELIALERKINDSMPQRVVDAVLRKKPDTVAILGVAYKPDVDDDRESPAHPIIRGLQDAGVAVRVHDPHVRGQNIHQDLSKALQGADLAVIVTDHAAYGDQTFSIPVLDTRNIGIPGAKLLGRDF